MTIKLQNLSHRKNRKKTKTYNHSVGKQTSRQSLAESCPTKQTCKQYQYQSLCLVATSTDWIIHSNFKGRNLHSYQIVLTFLPEITYYDKRVFKTSADIYPLDSVYFNDHLVRLTLISQSSHHEYKNSEGETLFTTVNML
jgi:hypothetical protein